MDFERGQAQGFVAVPVAIAVVTCCQASIFQMAYAAAKRQVATKRRLQLRRYRASFWN